MRVLLTILTFVFFHIDRVVAQQQLNLPLLANWDDNTIPPAWTGPYSECWGYSSNEREYAFLASTQGTYFFDITEPQNPVMIDFVRTMDTTTLVVNKDYATYSHYLYAVSDQGDNSLQIFDLQYLPDSVVLVYDENTLSKRCHTLFVEGDRLYMCSNTRPNFTFGKMDIMSLADPVNPVLIGTLNHPGIDLVHEVFVRNDTAYCSSGNAGLWIFSVKFPSTPSLLSVIDQYLESGYNHSSWLTDDSKTVVFTDENHGYGVKVFDITDFQNSQQLSLIRSNLLMVSDSVTSNGSVAHNPYIVGSKLFLSYYHDGVQVFDIANPTAPLRVGFYDTSPSNTTYAGYDGCWGLYPFLPSGNIIASDINNGLFILDGKKILNTEIPGVVVPAIELVQNPVSTQLTFNYRSNETGELLVEIFDITGKQVERKEMSVMQGNNNLTLPVELLASGLYIARISGEVDGLNFTTRFVKSND